MLVEFRRLFVKDRFQGLRALGETRQRVLKRRLVRRRRCQECHCRWSHQYCFHERKMRVKVVETALENSRGQVKRAKAFEKAI